MTRHINSPSCSSKAHDLLVETPRDVFSPPIIQKTASSEAEREPREVAIIKKVSYRKRQTVTSHTINAREVEERQNPNEESTYTSHTMAATAAVAGQKPRASSKFLKPADAPSSSSSPPSSAFSSLRVVPLGRVPLIRM